MENEGESNDQEEDADDASLTMAMVSPDNDSAAESSNPVLDRELNTSGNTNRSTVELN